LTDDFWMRARSLAASLDTISYYALLDVPTDADVEAIRAAYGRRVGELHPDRHARERDPDRRRALVSIQARLNEAYRALSTPQRRALYDRALGGGELRLVARPAAAPRPAAPRTPRGRLYFEAGQEREQAGDVVGARVQYQLAVQVEPDSTAIQEALARVSPTPPSPPSPPPVPEPAAPPEPGPTEPARADPRHPYRKPVRLQCRSWEHLITLHAHNLSRGGVFVRTASPLEVGTHVEVQLSLPDGRSLSVEADVARVVAPERADAREPAGMALRFLAMDAARQRAFDAALADAAVHAEAAVAAPPPPSPARAVTSDPIEEAVLREIQVEVARLREASRHGVLGVTEDATAEEIRAAYVALVKRYHPDLHVRYRSELVVDVAIDAFTLVQQAYTQLVAAPAPAPGPSAPPARSRPAAAASRAGAATAGHAAGGYAEARRVLEEAIRVDDDPRLRAAYHVAAGHEARAGARDAEAEAHFAQALVFDPTCEEAIRALRRPERR
jgi:uncharacterized protein (TIGR02266 family)